jgi:hypothetical protein
MTREIKFRAWDEEGDLYEYKCPKCGHNRGVLDHPFYSTSCGNCKPFYGYTSYDVRKSDSNNTLSTK